MFIQKNVNLIDNYKISKTFDEVKSSSNLPKIKNQIYNFKPKVNAREDNKLCHIEVELPGIKKDDITININENVLTISGKRNVRAEVKEENYSKTESCFGNFSRSFFLQQQVNIEDINTILKNGILEVIIPKIQYTSTNAKK